MKRNTLITTLGLAATMGFTALMPTIASANVQQDKNNMRNLAIAGAVVAGYGLLNHNTGATLLGAAGALIGESQYQKDQSKENSWNDRWNNRDYNRGGNWNDRWNNNNGDRYHQDYNRDQQDYNRDDHRDNNRDRDGDHNRR